MNRVNICTYGYYSKKSSNTTIIALVKKIVIQICVLFYVDKAKSNLNISI